MIRPLPAIGPPRGLRSLNRATETLANGLNVVVIERRELPVVEVDLVFMAGAALDRPQQAGRADLTAELIDEGTPARAALEIAEEVDQLGAHLSVHAAWDTTSASVHVLSPRLQPALDVLADVVCNASFPEAEFQRKRRERVTALMQERDEPRLLAGKALAAAAFGLTHPYGAPPGGTEASLAALTREDTVAFCRDHYAPSNAVLLVVGDVDATEMIATVERKLGGWRNVVNAREHAVPEPPATERRVLLVDRTDAAQAELLVGHAGPPRSTDDYFPLIVLNSLLGGSFTSRLNTILRERMGVTYGAASRFAFRRGGGMFSAGAAVFTEAVARSAQVIVEEMDRLRHEQVGAEELRRAQNYIALGLPRSFETTEHIAARIQEQIVYGLPVDYWQTYVERVFAVTPIEVARVAAQHLQPDRCVIAVVADQRKVRQALERTRLGPVLPTNVAT